MKLCCGQRFRRRRPSAAIAASNPSAAIRATGCMVGDGAGFAEHTPSMQLSGFSHCAVSMHVPPSGTGVAVGVSVTVAVVVAGAGFVGAAGAGGGVRSGGGLG